MDCLTYLNYLKNNIIFYCKEFYNNYHDFNDYCLENHIKIV